jgi:cytochrome c oxidase assembly protein subunit 15
MISKRLQTGAMALFVVLIIQVLLGISTVINSIGKTPIFLGVIHQAGALVLLICLLFVNFQFKKIESESC